MLRLTSLMGNSQRLDGGAMFGNVPRTLWERWCPPDEDGRIALSCRCFLVEDGERRLLIEAGVGAFFEPRLRERFGVAPAAHLLLDSLAELDLSPEDIDVVLLSHLHFDHAGGLLSEYAEGKPLHLAFPRAEFVVGQRAWERANDPHYRDRASFIPELSSLLEESGRLVVVGLGEKRHGALGVRVRLRESSGHSPGMLIPTLEGRSREATYCADLVPGVPWVHLPVTMGYDRFPEALIDEKRALYESLSGESWLLFTHDDGIAAGLLYQDKKGRYALSSQRKELRGWDLDA